MPQPDRKQVYFLPDGSNSIMSRQRTGLILVLTSACIWGSHGTLIKLAGRDGLHFQEIALLEFVIATLFFGACLFRPGMRVEIPPLRFLGLLALGGVGISVISYNLFWSFELSPVPVGATLIFLYLPTVFLIRLFTGAHRPSIRQWLAMIAILIGAVLGTNILKMDWQSDSLAGVLPGTIAGLGYGILFVLVEKQGNHCSALLRTFTFCLVGTLVLLVTAPLTGALQIETPLFTTLTWALILSFLGQVIPVFTLIKGLPMAGSTAGSIAAAIELPVAVAVSALVLNHPVNLLQITGIGLILGGIIASHWSPSRAKGPPPQTH